MLEKSRLFPALLLTVCLFPAGGRLFTQTNTDTPTNCFKHLTHYSAKIYKHHVQNWKVAQGPDNMIYVANQAGILQYDGVSWRIIKVPNWSVFSLAIQKDGAVFYGGKNEIGLLRPDSKGTLKYASLLDQVEEPYKKFSNVWDGYRIEDKVYFKTMKFLFRWDGKKMKVWQPEYNFNKSFTCEERLYLHDRKTGLLRMEMENEVPALVPGGGVFAGKKIYMMARFDDERLLIGTRANGFYLYDGSAAAAFLTEADDYLKANRLYHGIRLSSGDFALATLLGGVVIMDAAGHIKHIIDKESGLPDNHVNYVFEDNRGNLWLALNNGIVKIEYASPFSYYKENANLAGIVLTAARHHNRMYAGTTSGLFSQSSSGRFQPVAGVSGMCWSVLSDDGALLAASNDGIFLVQAGTVRKIYEGFSFFLLRSKQTPDRVWAGTKSGLLALSRQSGQWRTERKLAGINEDIRSVVEDEKGGLWLGTLTKGALNVDITSAAGMTNPVVTRFGENHGLPKGEVHVFWAAGHVIFASVKGIYRFDAKNGVFLPDFTLTGEFAGGKGIQVFRMAEDKQNHIWFYAYGRNIRAAVRPDGSYRLIKTPFLRLPKLQVNAIFPDGDAVWFAGNNGLTRFDKTIAKKVDMDYPALIRKVLVNGNLVYDGCKTGQVMPVIDYKDRNLRFQFAAPFFEEETAVGFQYFLEGYESGWSEWTPERKKDYTNIDAGGYRFRVRAKNIYGTHSRQDVFSFEVLSPWYRTWWAYSIYGLGLLLVMFLVVKQRSKHLEKEKRALEHIVEERTGEIRKKNLQLEEQSEKLKEMDHVKSRFFANISHEFRTPLTLIMGPLEQIIEKTPGKDELEKKANLMLRNSRRLLNLINQLLELSKLDSGEVKIEPAVQNIVPFLKGIAASFEPAAHQRGLDLAFHASEDVIYLEYDPAKMEEVMFNLLSNAVKFTPVGGKISLEVKTANDFVEITVSDTGPGIPRRQLAHVFDRFYQADSTYEHHQEGSGIGLAIAREIILLHHGEIEAHSNEGEGTAFIIRLPVPEAPEDMEIRDVVPVQISRVLPDIGPGGADTSDTAVPGSDEKNEKNIILVVEDNADVREYIRGGLEPSYRVEEAADGRRGILKAKEIIPDLIISDIMMPEVDGRELCRALKHDIETSHIPIILLTAKAAEENIIEGLESGADDYITKPFNTKILCARIKNLIDLRSQLQQNIQRELTLQPIKTNVTGIDKEFLDDLQAVIVRNISNPDFSVEELSKKLYMGRTTLYRKIQALSGETPTEFLRSYRLKQGAQLLKTGSCTVLEVAMEVGFSSSSYFARCFKDKFHQLPSQYQSSESS
jgi:signal transduction histidine kinase/DNA-binding NarL/FixJ family response regulator